jgi:peptidoglycan/xylan/chitin deacetylase (PgdA/CDA1 family)
MGEHAPRKKTLYLTVDDGPSATTMDKVEYLFERHIPAVFFCVGAHLEKWNAAAVHAIQRGFVIGNHSATHPRFSDTPLARCCREIEDTDRLIEALYRTAGRQRLAKWFRFPFGDKGDLKRGLVFTPGPVDMQRKTYLQSFLRELGYRQPAFDGVTYEYYRRAGLLGDVDWHWTFDVMEYATLEKRSIFRPRSFFGIRTLSQVLRRLDETRPNDARGELPDVPRWLGDPTSDEIVLLHDHDGTAAMFPRIVDRLIELPFRFGLDGLCT